MPHTYNSHRKTEFSRQVCGLLITCLLVYAVLILLSKSLDMTGCIWSGGSPVVQLNIGYQNRDWRNGRNSHLSHSSERCQIKDTEICSWNHVAHRLGYYLFLCSSTHLSVKCLHNNTSGNPLYADLSAIMEERQDINIINRDNSYVKTTDISVLT